jgi:hypothetical protein
MVQERNAKARNLSRSGHSRDAQDEFLRVLLVNLEDQDALHGLVAVRRQMAGDDPAVLRRQAAEYADGIRRRAETREHYTLPAMEILVTASLQAAKEIEASSRRTSRPLRNPINASRPSVGPRAEEEVLSNGRLALPVTHSAKPTRPQTSGLSWGSVPKAVEKPPTTPAKRTPPVPAASAHQAPPPSAASAPRVSPSAAAGPQTSSPPAASAATWGLSSPQTPPPPAASAATWGLNPRTSPAPAAPAAQITPPPPDPSRLNLVRVGPVSDRDLAAAITKQLVAGGFSQTRMTTQTGFRVVSEPLPRSIAEGVIATLAGRGFHSQVEPLGGDTVQLVFGTFTTQKEAETLSQRIAAAGYDAWVREGTVYTVQLGPYPPSSVNTITGIIKSGAPNATVIVVPAP